MVLPPVMIVAILEAKLPPMLLTRALEAALLACAELLPAALAAQHAVAPACEPSPPPH